MPPRVKPNEKPQTEARYDRLAILSYIITGQSSVLVVLQDGQGGLALVGIFAKLPWVLWGWRGSGNTSGS